MGVPFAGTLPAPRAIDSIKTRDCKVKMFHAMTEQEIDGFEDYLADVLCVWDCYEQEWVEKAPVILRFEKMDVLIQRPSVGGDAKLSVPTAGSEIGYPESGKTCNASADSCVCWRRADHYSFLIGRKFKGREMLRLAVFQRSRQAAEQ